jgi:D-lactate dehydrogenase (cytochrome)
MASFLRPLLQRTVRLGGKHASPGLRLYSAQTARSNSGRVALVTGICGIAIGFGAAQFLPQTKASEIPHKPVYGTVTDFDHAIEDLKHIFSTRLGVISTDPDDLKLHGLSTNTYHTGTVPIPFWLHRWFKLFSGVDHSVVVYPESTEDVVKIVKIANQYRMPITVCYPHNCG